MPKACTGCRAWGDLTKSRHSCTKLRETMWTRVSCTLDQVGRFRSWKTSSSAAFCEAASSRRDSFSCAVSLCRSWHWRQVAALRGNSLAPGKYSRSLRQTCRETSRRLASAGIRLPCWQIMSALKEWATAPEVGKGEEVGVDLFTRPFSFSLAITGEGASDGTASLPFFAGALVPLVITALWFTSPFERALVEPLTMSEEGEEEKAEEKAEEEGPLDLE